MLQILLADLRVSQNRNRSVYNSDYLPENMFLMDVVHILFKIINKGTEPVCKRVTWKRVQMGQVLINTTADHKSIIQNNSTPQPLYNTIVGVHSINRVS